MLKLIILSSLFSLGLYYVTQKGEPLYFIRRVLDKIGLKNSGEGRTWYYPILFCPVCMSSFHSVVVYLVFHFLSWATLYELPMIIICVYALNHFYVNQLYD